MKKLIFVTSNKHKIEEVGLILQYFGIEIEQMNIGYEEDKDDSMDVVAEKAARKLADKLNQPVIVEDTGLFFKAYNNFPGHLPKFVMSGIGFDGVFRLLKDKDRSATFKTVIGYAEPGQEPVLFDGEMDGRILEEVIEPEQEGMSYDHIFLPDGLNEPIIKLSLVEKNSVSQRGKAAKKLGEYLKKLK